MSQCISVVIPALNEAGSIEPLLDDLQAMRSRGHEVIVVDGGSSDATVSQATPWSDRVISAAPGRASQMNAGATIATGDVLWFLHADSRIPSDADATILGALSDPKKSWGRFDVRLSGDEPLLRVVELLMNLRSRATGIATGDQGIFATRDLFLSLGGFANLPLMEDIELSRRLKSHGRPACLSVRLTTSSRRWERNGVLRTVVLMWYLRLAYALGTDPRRLARQYMKGR